MPIDLRRPKSGVAHRSAARDLGREMEQVCDGSFRDWPIRWCADRGWSPPVDMVDRGNEVLVRVDLPGLSETDVRLSVDDGVLTISGAREDDRASKGGEYYYAERWAGGFSRSITLPSTINVAEIEASLKHGTLEIRLPKSADTSKTIDVEVHVRLALSAAETSIARHDKEVETMTASPRRLA